MKIEQFVLVVRELRTMFEYLLSAGNVAGSEESFPDKNKNSLLPNTNEPLVLYSHPIRV